MLNHEVKIEFFLWKTEMKIWIELTESIMKKRALWIKFEVKLLLCDRSRLNEERTKARDYILREEFHKTSSNRALTIFQLQKVKILNYPFFLFFFYFRHWPFTCFFLLKAIRVWQVVDTWQDTFDEYINRISQRATEKIDYELLKKPTDDKHHFVKIFNIVACLTEFKLINIVGI